MKPPLFTPCTNPDGKHFPAMLNITTNTIADKVDLRDFQSYRLLRKTRIRRLSLILVTGLMVGLFILLFLPWTQNVSAKGYVTTRSPESRPQEVQAIIPGRIERWFVQEGDSVGRGDTIVYITEVKSEYFDPELLDRTREQIAAKEGSVESYDTKVGALNAQYDALREALKVKRGQVRNKIQQAKNKIQIDSIDLVALRANLALDENQLERTRELYDKGLKTLTELQVKEQKVQSSRAKVLSQENKLINARNELDIARLDLLAAEREYADKLAKSLSDRQSAVSAGLESEAQVAKLRNQLGNYTRRQDFYYVTAPQSGFVVKTKKAGIGETVKEGDEIATIMPSGSDLALEVYLRPQDIPLVDIGEDATIRLDGWPAIVISGWPEGSTGIFPGEVVAIDRFLSDNGLYRVLISPHSAEDAKPWPAELRVGTGAQAFLLLNDVAIWYEIWRQLNGFPADYYQEMESADEVKRKAPIRSVK